MTGGSACLEKDRLCENSSDRSKTRVERELKFAPRHLFDQILEYCVVPTFDLVIQMPDGQVLLVRRKLAPYANKWALPGLRMFKPESIEDTLFRIAKQRSGWKSIHMIECSWANTSASSKPSTTARTFQLVIW